MSNDLDEQAESSTAPDAGLAATEADSSTASGAGPKTMLEAVQAAMQPTEPAEAKAPDSPTDGETGKTPATPTDTPPAEPAKLDDYKEVQFRKHPRFRQLLRERNTFHQQLQEKNAEISSLKETNAPQQETLQRFTKFTDAVRGADLNAQEVNDGFAIMAAMKRDPEKALEMLTPYVTALLTATGRQLDGELGQKVKDGVVDAETAAALQRERHTRARLEAQTTGQREAHERADQQRRTDVLVQSVTSAVSAWEERQKSDPDYQKKQPLVLREIGWLMQQLPTGYPESPQQAVELAEKAKKAVEANLASILPQRQAVRTVTGGASAVSAAARPKSLLEATRLAANGQYIPAA